MESAGNYDHIRPYYDQEVSGAIDQLLHDSSFMQLMKRYFIDQPDGFLTKKLRAIRSLLQFQEEMIYPPMKAIIANSSDGLTSSGFDALDKSKAYLFISNHRDIILDSALLNLILFEKGFNTTEIAIGNNLLLEPWITSLVKLNKSFIVQRDLTGRQQLEFSQQLSAYMRETITQRGTSIWLAQRQGRTKDGNDLTQSGLLRMLDISGSGTFEENFSELNIVPLSISYEFDPCDLMKLWELEPGSDDIPEEAHQQVDLSNMIAGITGRKGHMHFHAGTPIKAELSAIQANDNRKERLSQLAKVIDQQIYAGYQLRPIHFAAADLDSDENRWSDRYTVDDKAALLAYIDGQIATFPKHVADARAKMIRMYAWSVYNHYSIAAPATSEAE